MRFIQSLSLLLLSILLAGCGDQKIEKTETKPKPEESTIAASSQDSTPAQPEPPVKDSQPDQNPASEELPTMAVRDSLRLIGRGMHEHHDVYTSFGSADGSLPKGRVYRSVGGSDEPDSYPSLDGPPQDDGAEAFQGRKGGLSWRVHLLPFLGQEELFKKFKLDEPWNSESNRKLISEMPKVFRVKGVNKVGETSIHVFVGQGAPFADGRSPFSINDCIDGTSGTILAVAAGPDTAEVWTKPGGLQHNVSDPLKPLGQIGETFAVVTVDGSVYRVSRKLDPKTLAAIISASGLERIDLRAVFTR